MKYLNFLFTVALVATVFGKNQPEKIYFTSDKEGNWDIYSIDINSKEVTQITTSLFDEKDLFITSNRERLVFVSGDGYIKRMSLESNSIIDSFTVDSNFTYAVQPSEKDGEIFFSYLYDRKKDVSSICTFGDSTITPVVSMPSSLFFPIPVSGTNKLAYTFHMCSYDCGSFVTEIWEQNRSSGINKQLTMAGSHIIDLSPYVENQILFSSNMNGTMGIFSLNLEDRKITELFDTPAEEISPASSPDNSSIVFIQRENKTQLKIMDIASGEIEEITPFEECDYMEIVW
jgi:Tol biopolymer transport system component